MRGLFYVKLRKIKLVTDMGNWINICFVIDESGSMFGSIDDVVGGFNRVIEEQKKNKDGKVTVSLYTFSDHDKVNELYRGVDINDIAEFKYNPGGLTALYDGVGKAIDNIGKWLYEKDQNHEEMPAKTMFVVMTDGGENNSREYKLQDIKDRIKTQEEVYSWEFVYVGMDLTTKSDANNLGFKNQLYAAKKSINSVMDSFNFVTSCYRCEADLSMANSNLSATLTGMSKAYTEEYEKDRGIKLED